MKLKLCTLLSQPIKTVVEVACFSTFVFLVLVSIPTASHAATYSLSPLIIEHTAEPRDMFEESIRITNTSNAKTRIFPTVNEITLGEGGEIKEFIPASMSDNTTSVTSWIEVTRGRVEVNPGETHKLPVFIKVNPNAQPGEYYVFLGLAEGTKREDAEEKVKSGAAPGIIIRLELADTKNEYLRLHTYQVDRMVIDEASSQITYEVENIGDTVVTPTGEIIIYNIRGQEVGSLPINADGISIPASERVAFNAPLPEIGFLGKYKAFLTLQYGSTQGATIYDTAYFTLIPLPALLGAFAATLVITMIGALSFYRFRNRDYDEDDDAVAVYVRSGSQAPEKDHDINLKN